MGQDEQNSQAAASLNVAILFVMYARDGMDMKT